MKVFDSDEWVPIPLISRNESLWFSQINHGTAKTSKPLCQGFLRLKKICKQKKDWNPKKLENDFGLVEQLYRLQDYICLTILEHFYWYLKSYIMENSYSILCSNCNKVTLAEGADEILVQDISDGNAKLTASMVTKLWASMITTILFCCWIWTIWQSANCGDWDGEEHNCKGLKPCHYSHCGLLRALHWFQFG